MENQIDLVQQNAIDFTHACICLLYTSDAADEL
mgnify:CR=1 FL=1